ncbi:hypothetical protein DDZ18_03275 [Marinicauda salina]|uniref:Lysoplasmalogenase n=1 Tax=Marinicauda salina TaxID=2135793 RepID=A0A2U2BX81_9PROT|nr:lysoplasmalogenase [Marinicauda salina]PWE18633.1 hypothetical protein DDZ18_03275 [Marinicauda salina]
MTARETEETLIPDWAAPVYLVVSAACAFAFLALDLTTTSMPGMAALKAVGIVMLAAYAGFSRAPLLALALVLSACGDYALEMQPARLAAGIGFFGAAHLAYIAIFAGLILGRGWRRDGLVLAGALVVYGAAMIWWLRPYMGGLAGPAIAYNVIILAMAICAALVRGPRLILLGALLFVISDSILGASWFRELNVAWGRFDLDGAAVWTTYYLAQAALAVGIVRAKADDEAD